MVLFPGTSFNLHVLIYVFLVLTLVLTNCSSIILNNIHHKQCKHHHYIDLGNNCHKKYTFYLLQAPVSNPLIIPLQVNQYYLINLDKL